MTTTTPKYRISLLSLLFTALLWGFAFVAQRKSVESLDPLIFNGIRFSLGALFVSLLVPWHSVHAKTGFPWMPGIILFFGASLQQIGMVWTTAGNGGFITGLYVVFVPLLGIFRGHKFKPILLLAVMLSIIGIYLISVKTSFTLNIGDGFVLISAVFWAIHVQIIDHYAQTMDSFLLAFSQYAVVALGSLMCGLINIYFIKLPGTSFDRPLFEAIPSAGIPILYGGLISVGIAYTLQIQGQRHVKPATAAIILCLEGAFAVLGGWLLLGEAVTVRMLVGAFLMLTSMIISILSSMHKET